VMLNHKEMAAHLRKRIRQSGISARVKMNESCGYKYITVVVPCYGEEFTESEQREIRHIAKCNKLTRVRGSEINVDRMTDPIQMDFYMPTEQPNDQ
jgi:hypothetical protein